MVRYVLSICCILLRNNIDASLLSRHMKKKKEAMLCLVFNDCEQCAVCPNKHFQCYF